MQEEVRMGHDSISLLRVTLINTAFRHRLVTLNSIFPLGPAVCFANWVCKLGVLVEQL